MAKEKEKNIDPELNNKVTLDPETGEIKADKALKDYTNDDDALNPVLNRKGQGIGTHEVDINKQTGLELGALADPGGVDPSSDQNFLEDMKKQIKKNQ